MKRPLTDEAFGQFKAMNDQLSFELRSKYRMRYGKTISLVETMLDLMIADRSWEKRKSNGMEASAELVQA